MNLPRISYLTNGPAAPERSLDAAAAPARAMAQIGQQLFQAGQKGFEVAEKLRKTKEAGIRAEFMAKQQAEDAEFESSLLYRSDFENFGKEYQERATGRRGEMEELGLSAEGKAILGQQFLDYTTQQGIRIETQAALRTHREGVAKVTLGLQQAARRGDRDGMNRHLTEMGNYGASDTDVETARVAAETEARGADWRREIRHDPVAAQEKLGNPELVKDLPPGELDQYRALARQEISIQASELTEDVLDGILSSPPTITTEEQIKQATKGMRPAARQRLVNTLKELTSQQAKDKMADPKNQDAAVGKMKSLILTYKPDRDGFDEAYIEISSTIRMLPPSPVREELERSLQRSREGQERIIDSLEESIRAELDEKYLEGAFGTGNVVVTSVPALLAGGILSDGKKLTARGINPDHVQAIIAEDPTREQLEALGLSPEKARQGAGKGLQARLVRYREFAAIPRVHPDTLDEWNRSAFDAIDAGKRDYERPDQAAQTARDTAFGWAQRELEKGLKRIRNLDDTKGKQLIRELIAPTAKGDFVIEFATPVPEPIYIPGPNEASDALLPPYPGD